METFWNQRYAAEEYIYGESPNVFFKERLDLLEPGRILLPAEGEGRNGVYAGTQGWQVDAFDISEEGKRKALKLAEKQGVRLNYQVAEFSALAYPDTTFDAIALIYAHFPAEDKSAYHKALVPYLKKGGVLILEGFSKKQIEYQKENPQAGGPKDVAMLYDTSGIARDFSGLEVILLEETEVELSEGPYHRGKGSVVRFVGRKR